MRVTYLLSNTAGIGLILLRKSAIGSMSRSSSTPAFFAAVSASSGIGSHAPNTMSSSLASGTKSLMRGARLSVLLPRRIVAICVREPIGLEWPRRMLSTPAMNVVATAPSPGVRMPSRPLAGAIDLGTSPEDDLAKLYLRCDLRLRPARRRHSRCLRRGSRRVGGCRCGRGRGVRIADDSDLRWTFFARARPRVHVLGSMVDKRDSLHGRDPGGNGEEKDNAHQHPSIPEKTKQRLRSRQQYNPLRTLHYADLGVDAQ